MSNVFFYSTWGISIFRWKFRSFERADSRKTIDIVHSNVLDAYIWNTTSRKKQEQKKLKEKKTIQVMPRDDTKYSHNKNKAFQRDK